MNDNTIITSVQSFRFRELSISYETYIGDIDFSYSIFTSAKNIKIRHPLIVYKIGYLCKDERQIMTLITLKIPLTARITIPFGEYNTKLRCSRAKVLDINPIEITDGIPYVMKERHLQNCMSLYGNLLKNYENTVPINYIVGETVRPDKYNHDRRLICAQGIHFFLTKHNAISYLITNFSGMNNSSLLYANTKCNEYFGANEDIQFYNPKDWR